MAQVMWKTRTQRLPEEVARGLVGAACAESEAVDGLCAVYGRNALAAVLAEVDVPVEVAAMTLALFRAGETRAWVDVLDASAQVRLLQVMGPELDEVFGEGTTKSLLRAKRGKNGK
jgi:hypothetical protein